MIRLYKIRPRQNRRNFAVRPRQSQRRHYTSPQKSLCSTSQTTASESLRTSVLLRRHNWKIAAWPRPMPASLRCKYPVATPQRHTRSCQFQCCCLRNVDTFAAMRHRNATLIRIGSDAIACGVKQTNAVTFEAHRLRQEKNRWRTANAAAAG